MIKRITILLTLILFSCISRIYAWQIEDFKINIDINQDSSIIITEKILADFSDEPKHGILRNIPVSYRDETGKSLNISFQILGILDESGNPWQYSESHSGIYKVLKIGSPHVTYKEQKTFILKYKVTGAILFLENHDELFWNAIGTEWDAAINNIAVNVHLPVPVKKEYLSTAVYTGRYGSRSSNIETRILDEQNIVFTGRRYLPYEGVTVVVGLPKGIIEPLPVSANYTSSETESTFQSYASSYSSKGFMSLICLILLIPLILPAVVFFIMFSIWKKSGKDPKLEKSVVVEYKVPEDLKPAEMGTLIDDRIDMRDVSSTIIDLAIRGYLKIIKRDAMFFQKKFSFVLLKEYNKDESLSVFERTILDGFFAYANAGASVELLTLENDFYKKLPLIKNDIFERLIEKGFYSKNPEQTGLFYRIISFVFGFLAVFTMVLIPIGIGLGLSAIIIFCFAKYMPAKTRKGMDVYGKVLGFEEFLMRTEKDKIQYEEQQEIFEKMLPYAICLGISNKWTMIFSDLYKQPPNWFDSDLRDGFTMQGFIYDLDRSMNSMNHSFSSMPRTVSSGGGFSTGGSSGGGFGGGGGSSW